MPLQQYGVWKGQAIDRRLATGGSPHFEIHIVDEAEDARIAVNVRSQAEPSVVLYYADVDFHHPVTDGLAALPLGFAPLPSTPGGLACDFIRDNLFDVAQMRPLPANLPGSQADLDHVLDGFVQRAMHEADATVYAFGVRWGPEKKSDRYFGFRPGAGIHDIHMNQGNTGKWVADDGPWQDGALLLHFPSTDHWVAVFIAFQSQCFHTDDRTGHCLRAAPGEPAPAVPVPAGAPGHLPGRTDVPVVKIVAALVNPRGDDVGTETVTLLNTSTGPIDLDGWMIADRVKRKEVVHNLTVPAGQTAQVQLSGRAALLGNAGGIITLLDPHGTKIDGVSYTRDDAREPGRTLTF